MPIGLFEGILGAGYASYVDASDEADEMAINYVDHAD